MTLFIAGGMLKRIVLVMVASTLTACFSSCDSMFHDGEGDCAVHYRLSFRYTKNILNSDAFSSQVSAVNVAIYDKQGNMVYSKSDTRALSPENDYYLDVDVRPGTYDIIAWCEGESIVDDAISFELQGQSVGDRITASGAKLPMSGTSAQPVIDSDIKGLYYGSLTDVEFPNTYGTVDITPVQLVKDTNHITLQLQNMDGKPLDNTTFTFELEGANSSLDWQNKLTGNQAFNYNPWSVEPTYTLETSPTNAESRADVPSGIQADFTTGRIMAGVPQQLTVRNALTGELVLTFPLVKYLLLVRGKYDKATSDQDYLDRYDNYTLVFFLEKGFVWDKSHIYINGWRVVPPQDEHL